MQQLTVQNDDLSITVETLKTELISSNEEAERASRELEAMRSRALQENAQEVYLRERELREAQADLEQIRIERDEWEQKALQEHIVTDETRTALEMTRRDLEVERDARERESAALQIEREKTTNHQSEMEDFQAGALLQLTLNCLWHPDMCSSQRSRTASGCQGVRRTICTTHSVSR